MLAELSQLATKKSENPLSSKGVTDERPNDPGVVDIN